jgi:UDP-N-acetylglucosamine 2-epimerase (non-hydrolysing)
VSIVGGRPHLIKAESIDLALRGTGVKHDVIRASLSAVSDYPRDSDFGLPTPLYRVHSERREILARRLTACIEHSSPAVLLLYGDLTATAAAADAARACEVPFVHVEAGYRSWDATDEEERTRVEVDRHARAHLVYNDTMVENLMAGGISPDCIFVVADPARVTLRRHLQSVWLIGVAGSGGGLVTFHHDETFQTPGRLRHLLGELGDLARSRPLDVVLYARTERELRRAKLLGWLRGMDGITVHTTLRFREYLQMLVRARFVVTDSSGVQDDCLTLGRPCVVVRRASPRPPADAIPLVPEIDRLCWRLPSIVAAALATPAPAAVEEGTLEELRGGLLGALWHATTPAEPLVPEGLTIDDPRERSEIGSR